MVTAANDPRVGAAIPRAVIVGITAVVAAKQFLGRRKIILVNNSDTLIYLGQGHVPVVNTGIPLYPNGGNYVDEPDTENWIYTGTWYAISSAATKNLCISES